MRFTDSTLQAGLETWRRATDVRERATADNMWFEERVSPPRLAAFEEQVNSPDAPDHLPDRQSWYWKRFVRYGEPTPDTFAADLEPARLGPGPLEPFQPIVRLEDLRTPLHDQGLALVDLESARRENQTAVLDRFLASWNDVRDARPAFAAWKDQVLDEVAAPDWPDRLRDRLGLAHYDPTAGPIPVVLMQYTVQDVLDEAASLGLPHAFTAPTVLDSAPWPYFFPAPKELPYGRAMPLAPTGDDNQLLAEMLHIRLTYTRDHILDFGEIRRRPGAFDLRNLRNHHLMALQLASDRYDFGEEIPGEGIA